LKDKTRELIQSLSSKISTTENSSAGLFESAPKGRFITKTVLFGDVSLRVYAVGFLARALDRSTATVRRWQRRGVIPPPCIKTKDGARWYLKEEIEIYSRMAKKFALHTGSCIESTGFPEEVTRQIDSIKRKLNKLVQEAKNESKA